MTEFNMAHLTGLPGFQAIAHQLQQWNQFIQQHPNDPKAYVQRGMTFFKLGKIAESIQDFDHAEQLDPRLTPYLWQRGLSFYYADRFEAGAKQFEIDLTVNAQDVEETVWRYLCLARLNGQTAAQNSLLEVKNDPRRVMRSVYELFAGSVTLADVLAIGMQEGSHGKFYSNLYVGLYYEAAADPVQAKKYIEQAVHCFQTEYTRDDYMGYLAIVHQHLRGWA